MLTNIAVVAALLGLPQAWAGFNAKSANNLAIYWGQNSAGQKTSQSRLSTYCQNSPMNIIPLAFLDTIKTTTVNFASATDQCTLFPGTQLMRCPEIEADIKTCQSLGKTITLSIGGATYGEGFTSEAEAVQWANTVWAMFGPMQNGTIVNRPFGEAVIDGFDFDFEAVISNLIPFASTLRALMDSASDKKYYLTGAPQCFFPDAAMGGMLAGAVSFDFLMIQFYNNYCGVNAFIPGAETQNNFNYDTWHNWARQTSKNKDVKLLIGAPATASAGGGYVPASQLASIIGYAKNFDSFGGVMLWDMSQAFANPGFIDTIAAALGNGASLPAPVSSQVPTPVLTPIPTPTSIWLTSIKPSAAVTATFGSTPASLPSWTPPPSGSQLVPQWGQCGGEGYTGVTQCEPPYTCVVLSNWWASCK